MVVRKLLWPDVFALNNNLFRQSLGGIYGLYGCGALEAPCGSSIWMQRLFWAFRDLSSPSEFSFNPLSRRPKYYAHCGSLLESRHLHFHSVDLHQYDSLVLVAARLKLVIGIHLVSPDQIGGRSAPCTWAIKGLLSRWRWFVFFLDIPESLRRSYHHPRGTGFCDRTVHHRDW